MDEEKERNRDDEILTDNTEIPYCEQCEDCRYREKKQVKYCLCLPHRKSFCEVYAEKPRGIINNKEKCKFYTKERKR